MKKLTAIVMAVFLLYSGYVFGTVSAADEIYTTRTVTVYSGDTMWDIASRWAEDDEDVRAVIYRICEANGLQNTDLQPGQKIMVPVRVHAGEGVMLAEATNGNLIKYEQNKSRPGDFKIIKPAYFLCRK